jgi:predicted enzyme related to lactoylglutathione lyase
MSGSGFLKPLRVQPRFPIALRRGSIGNTPQISKIGQEIGTITRHNAGMTFLPLLAVIAGATLAEIPPPLRVTMISIGVTDMDRSIRFYTETLGLPMAGPRGEVTMIRAGEITIALNRPLARSAPQALAGAVEVIFSVESVSSMETQLASRGCAFIASSHEVTPGLWAATFTDPDGHKLTLLGRR